MSLPHEEGKLTEKSDMPFERAPDMTDFINEVETSGQINMNDSKALYPSIR